MSIPVPNNHHIIKAREKIEEISKNFLDGMGFSYFQYLRCYADGSIGLLSNKSNVLCEYFSRMPESPAIFSSLRQEHKNLPNYWFLWDEELRPEPVGLVGNLFQAWNGLTLVKRFKSHYDMIAVALPFPIANAGSFYMNKLGAIEYFVDEFERHHRDMLRAMDHQPLALPKPYQDINVDKMCLDRGRTHVNAKQGKTHLTQQELACLWLVSQGHTYKSAAQHLGLSPRSVETYIKRAKVRTGCSSRAEIKEVLSCQYKERTD